MRFIQTAGVVDGTGDAIFQDAEHLGLLSLRQAARRHGIVELVLRGGDKCVDQAVDGLAVCCRNLGEALATLELGTELRFRDADVAGRSLEATEELVVAEAGMEPAEKPESVRRDALLDGITFGLRDAPRGDCRIDAVAERLLERVAQFAGRDSESLRGIVDNCLALRARRTVLRARDRRSGACGGEQGYGADNYLGLSVQFHERRQPVRSKSTLRTS